MNKQLLSAVSLLLLLEGCGGKTAVEAERNHILVAGSSTVYPFTKAIADAFQAKHKSFAKPVVESTGTNAGFKAFCAGLGAQHPDLVDASRRMKLAELQECRANGVDQVVELQIGLDGLAFVQSASAPVIKLTRKELYEAIAARPYGQPNATKRWNDVNPSLPDFPILFYGPPASSGTRDTLAELIMTGGCDTDGSIRTLKTQDERRYTDVCTTVRTDGPYVESGEDDAKTTMKLIVNPGAVGIVGYSFLEENAKQLRGIPVNGVAPSNESIIKGTYPGARPLFIYVKKANAERAGLKEFLAEYMGAIGPEGRLAKLGLVPAAEATRTAVARNATAMAALDASKLE